MCISKYQSKQLCYAHFHTMILNKYSVIEFTTKLVWTDLFISTFEMIMSSVVTFLILKKQSYEVTQTIIALGNSLIKSARYMHFALHL